MKIKIITYFTVILLLFTAISPGVKSAKVEVDLDLNVEKLDKEERVLEFMKRRIKLDPMRSPDKKIIQKEDVTTYQYPFLSGVVSVKSGGDQIVTYEPGEIEDYWVRRNGEIISKDKFYEIIGQHEEAEEFREDEEYVRERRQELEDRETTALYTAMGFGLVSNINMFTDAEIGEPLTTIGLFGSFGWWLLESNIDGPSYPDGPPFEEATHLAELYNQKLLNKLNLKSEDVMNKINN